MSLEIFQNKVCPVFYNYPLIYSIGKYGLLFDFQPLSIRNNKINLKLFQMIVLFKTKDHVYLVVQLYTYT